MADLLTFILIGLGVGLIVFPIGLGIYVLFKNTFEKRRIKRLLKKDKFLVTIDPKDYDVQAWTNKRYGNIDVNKTREDLENLNTKIFKIKKDIVTNQVNQDFINKLINYIKQARKLGYSDKQIKNEFRRKKYTNDIINQVFQHG